jgi:hypothetical protein
MLSFPILAGCWSCLLVLARGSISDNVEAVDWRRRRGSNGVEAAPYIPQSRPGESQDPIPQNYPWTQMAASHRYYYVLW